MSGDVQWPLDLLVGELRAMRTLACNEAADQLLEAAVAGDALAAEVARLRASLSGDELAQKLIAVMDDEVGKPTGQPVTEFLQLLLRENAELSALAAVVAAVHTALDQLEADKQRHLDGGPYVGMPAFVSAIAEAVER